MTAPLAVTMGDASGVGPEIVLRLAAQGQLDDVLIYGDAEILRAGAVGPHDRPAFRLAGGLVTTRLP